MFWLLWLCYRPPFGLFALCSELIQKLSWLKLSDFMENQTNIKLKRKIRMEELLLFGVEYLRKDNSHSHKFS